MGGDRNTVHLLTRNGNGADIHVESWPVMTKEEVATALVARIAESLTGKILTATTVEKTS
jgi:phosphopantothenoylcysteine decarboxylase/phosphopantothenate--cysteine ligase